MITRLELENFKNFKQATLNLGPLAVLIGTNASGKSNLREAFRFLNGIARGYSLADIFGGKYVAGQLTWEGLRGGYREVCFHGTNYFKITAEVGGFIYSIKIGLETESINPIRVIHESLFASDGELLFDARDKEFFIGDQSQGIHSHVSIPSNFNEDVDDEHQTVGLYYNNDNPVLPKLVNHFLLGAELKGKISPVFTDLLNMRFLDLSPDAMRIPSTPGQTVLGDHGENLPSVLQAICANANLKAALLEWVRQLTPMDVDDFVFLPDPSGKIVLGIKERSGATVTAYSVSDGTLRFLGLLAAMINAHDTNLYFLEEIENGIHPTRIGLLINFIEQHIKQNPGALQVITTTHSPQLLRFLSPENRDQSSLVYRLEDQPDARIIPVAEMPHIQEVLKKTDMAELHESGWFENVASFLADEEPIR